MRKIVLVIGGTFLLLSLIFLFVGTKSVNIQEVYVAQEEYVPNEVLVKFKKDVSKYFIQDTINSVQGKIITYLGEEISLLAWDPAIASLRSFRLDPDLFHVRVPEAIGTEKAISVLIKNPNVKYAVKNGIVHAQTTPNDDHFDLLWGLHNIGQAGGTVDADIDAPEAWDVFTGSSNIVVAVIDTGVDYNHDDLEANIWINPGESGNGKETNGVDDDNNGYEDDWHGWDFVPTPEDNDPMDDNWYGEIYHGTHVAGTIGAVGNNGEGVTGVNWNVKIMPLRALNQFGMGSSADAVHAIDYSTENGAHLSNNSWGGYIYSQPIYEAITRAKNAGKLFIAIAGNYAKNNDIEKYYPASYPHPNIISVAATSNKDELSIFSNYGPTTVDLGAPGGYWLVSGEQPGSNDIFSTKRFDDYQYLMGTSMAAPHVSGVAALVWGYRTDIGYKAVKSVIMDGIDPKPSLSGKVLSGGRLNAYNALVLAEALPPPPAAPSNLRAVGYCWEVKLTWQDNSDNEDGFKIYRRSGSEYYYLRSVGPNVTTYWDIELPCGQHWCYKIRAYNLGGDSPYSNIDCDWTLPCSQCGGGPLSLKINADKEVSNSGESVTLEYEVENKGTVDLFNIEIVDDRVGVIATRFNLRRGESKNFTLFDIFTETTTILCEAIGTYQRESEIKTVKAHAYATIEIRK